VTRGTETVVVAGTGSTTDMGRIANLVTSPQQRSALQEELEGMTKISQLRGARTPSRHGHATLSSLVVCGTVWFFHT
jgi:hypothetical protein